MGKAAYQSSGSATSPLIVRMAQMSLRTVFLARVHQDSSSVRYPDDAFPRALSVTESQIVASQMTSSQTHLMKMRGAVT